MEAWSVVVRMKPYLVHLRETALLNGRGQEGLGVRLWGRAGGPWGDSPNILRCFRWLLMVVGGRGQLDASSRSLAPFSPFSGTAGWARAANQLHSSTIDATVPAAPRLVST